MTQPIRFYYDLLSPYAYLAWTQIHAIAARHERTVEPVAILLAALLDTHGQKGPAEIPAKRLYVFKDVFRTAHHFGVPIGIPPAHPFNPLLGLRAASLPMARAQRRQVVDGLFQATWGARPTGVTDPAVVADILSRAGLDGQAAVTEASSDESKARVRAQTEAAIAEGTFGVPTMIVDGELFWGVDSLAHVERRLLGQDPADQLDVSRWRDLPASATRTVR